MVLRWFAGGSSYDISLNHGVHYQEIMKGLWIVVDLVILCEELKSSLVSITLFEGNNYRIGAQNITASSFKIKEVQTFIQDKIKKLSKLKKLAIVRNAQMGKVKYSSLRKTFKSKNSRRIPLKMKTRRAKKKYNIWKSICKIMKINVHNQLRTYLFAK